MGRLITNPPKPVVRVKVAQTNYKGIANLAQTVHDSMVANVGTFATPVPTMVTFQSDITALKAAIGTIGTKFNKGSHSQLMYVQNCAHAVFNELTSLTAYVQSLIDPDLPADNQRYTISLSGFAVKSKKSKIDKMQFVRNAHQSNNKQFPVTLRRIAWRRSLGMFKGVRANAYNIYAIPAVGSPIFLTSVTKTNYLVPLLTPAGTSITSVIIHPVNAQGEGAGCIIPVKGT